MSEPQSIQSNAVKLLERMAQSKNPMAAKAAQLELSRLEAEWADWTCAHEPRCRTPRLCRFKDAR